MELSTQIEERLFVVTVKEARIDAAVALEFKNSMRKITEDGPDTVILDLGQVGFIDSSGLGAIVATLKHLAPERTLILAGLLPAVDKVFALTRMDSVFRIFSTLDQALEALATGRCATSRA